MCSKDGFCGRLSLPRRGLPPSPREGSIDESVMSATGTTVLELAGRWLLATALVLGTATIGWLVMWVVVLSSIPFFRELIHGSPLKLAKEKAEREGREKLAQQEAGANVEPTTTAQRSPGVVAAAQSAGPDVAAAAEQREPAPREAGGKDKDV